MSFRIAGTDGVSLEGERWRQILTSMGHRVTFVAGQLDRPGILVPELHFNHSEVSRVHQMVANVFSLPIHFPLAVALERVINEYKIYSIARNHDFWWERQRYLKSHL